MKRNRLNLIRKIIAERHVSTQEELTALLLERGEKVTQATVSRDIRELMLVKVYDGVGSYHYVCPVENSLGTPSQLQKNLQNSIVDIVANDSLVVVHTLPGAANFVALTIDTSKWDEVIGTIAGDDTVFLALRDTGCKKSILEKLKEYNS